MKSKIKKPTKKGKKVLGVSAGLLTVAAVTVPTTLVLLKRNNKQSTKITDKHLSEIVGVAFSKNEGHYLQINKEALTKYGLKVQFINSKNINPVANRSIALFGQKDIDAGSTNTRSQEITYQDFKDHSEEGVMHHEDLHHLDHNQTISLKFTRDPESDKNLFPIGFEEIVEYKTEIINQEFLNEVFSDEELKNHPIVFNQSDGEKFTIPKNELTIEKIREINPDHYLVKSIKEIPLHEHLEFKFFHEKIDGTKDIEISVIATIKETETGKEFDIIFQGSQKNREEATLPEETTQTDQGDDSEQVETEGDSAGAPEGDDTLDETSGEENTIPPIPEDAKIIEEGNYDHKTLPKEFTIPDSVTEIGDGAFAFSTLPEGFTIPPGVETGERIYKRVSWV